MFTKKIKEPTTVAEAIAPFRQVQEGLITVLKQKSARQAEAKRRIEDAKNYAAKVEDDETKVIAATSEEMHQAAKISAALEQILGGGSISKTEEERAAKMGAARDATT